MSLNQATIMGRICNDLQVEQISTGTSLLKFVVAVSESYKGKETTAFIPVTAFGKSAETISQYLEKGDPIIISGKIRVDQWEAEDGSKKSKTYILLDKFNFVPKVKEKSTQPAQQVEDGEIPF